MSVNYNRFIVERPYAASGSILTNWLDERHICWRRILPNPWENITKYESIIEIGIVDETLVEFILTWNEAIIRKLDE